MSPVFLDSGYLIALESATDRHHASTVAHWRELILANPQPRLVTTSLVVNEVMTFFAGRGRHAKAIEIGNRLLASTSVQVVHLDEDLFRAAFDFLRSRFDTGASLTDCVSLLVMERFGIREALSFDPRFARLGFTLLPPAP